MDIGSAITKRTTELCKTNGISLYSLSYKAVINYSTLKSAIQRKSVNIGLVVQICQGLEISLSQFFDSPLFEEIDQN